MKHVNTKDSEMKKWRRNRNKFFALMRNTEEEQVIPRDYFRTSGEKNSAFPFSVDTSIESGREISM